MEEREEVLYHYEKLKALLDADEEHITRCLNGDLMDSYQQIIDREKEVLRKVISRFNQ